jgi:hypothetical protein
MPGEGAFETARFSICFPLEPLSAVETADKGDHQQPQIMAENQELPGWPKRRFVREVRAHLRSYGIRPQGQAWRATWEWAGAIANSYVYTHWPLPSEI